MTRSNFFRLPRMVAVLAGMILLFVGTLVKSNVAHAQMMPPCDSFWVDTDIPPGVTANLNWAPTLPPTTPTSVFSPFPPGYTIYGTTPGPGTLNSFSFTLPCGATIGPFSGPWTTISPGFCVPDPCHPGQCLFVRAYMLGPAPNGCPYELQVFQGTQGNCPGGCK